jgi:predicted nuclease of predicted toxin-antitoxin system
MLRILADENFNGRIVRGLLRRIPQLDILRAQDIEDLYQAIDPVVLQWAADEQRVVVSHDISTMAHHAYERVRRWQPMPGLFEVHPDLPVGQAIEDLVLIAVASLPGEWEGQVRFLPL